MKLFNAEDAAPLKEAFDQAVLERPDVETTTMFGCPSYQAAGTLFAVLVTDGIALTRLTPDQRAQVKEAFDGGPFEAPGRTVERWVLVPAQTAEDIADLADWIETSYENALEEAPT